MGEKPSNAYQHTILLPTTEFPMRADLATREPETAARWRDTKLYERMLERRADAPTFILHDGPPYANGSIHHGHVLNRTLKDIVVKFRTMQGMRTPFVPGWDCHGLPIEQKILQEIVDEKRDFTTVPIDEIRRRCAAYATRYQQVQAEEFRRILCIADYDHPYKTIDRDYQAAIARDLGHWMRNGHVYRALRPVLWDWVYRTALAEAEIEYVDDHVSPQVYVAFSFVPGDADRLNVAGLADTAVVIWTTTPWTLPANTAVALHPEFTYVLAERDGRGYVFAESLFQRATAVLGGEWTVRAAFPARVLEGARLRHPWLDRESRIVFADYVTADQGTGCVHTAPGHGVDDFYTGLRENLPVLVPVDDDGRFTADVERYAGKNVFAANRLIIDDLAASGRLLSKPDLVYKHRYPFSWRSHKPVIFRATPQWFLRLDHNGLRERALHEINRVRWLPDEGKSRIQAMVAGRPDWCISRQRAWGVPIPVFACTDCGADHVNADTAEHVAALFAEHGADVWFSWPAEQLLPPGAICAACGGANLVQHRDIVDVWFDSGTSWSAVLNTRPELRAPADLYLEGSDQHRGWFNSSLWCAVEKTGRAPYETVLTHGFVLGEDGEKLSKSKKNYVPLDKALQQNGAEVLRLWVAASEFRNDMRFGAGILGQLSESYRKIRNTLRWLLGATADFDAAADSPPHERLRRFDRWMIARTNEAAEAALRAYDRYDFHIVHHELLDFCIRDLSSIYFDAVKDRLYCDARASVSRRSVQTALHHVLHTLIRLYAPILSHTADEAWHHARKPAGAPDAVLLLDLPAPARNAADDALLASFSRAFAYCDPVLKRLEAFRREGRKSVDAAVRFAADNADVAAVLDEHRDAWAELLVVSAVTIESGISPGLEPADTIPGLYIAVEPAPGTSCARCRLVLPEVGTIATHPDLCGRCAEVVNAL